MFAEQFINKTTLKKGGPIMKTKSQLVWMVVFMALISWAVMPVSTANAQKNLKFSCSAQIYDAFEKDLLGPFSRETGIKIDPYVSSSGSALYRLMNNFSDIASTTRELYRRHSDYGYTQIPFCKDPLAVIAKTGCGVVSITEEQLQAVFSGTITNWKELGGADMPIVVVAPGEHTGANKNFRRQVMKHKEIKYEYMAYKSTGAIDLVKSLPCGSISFSSEGAAIQEEGLTTLKISDYLPKDKNYPYYQLFYFVTKGEPSGAAKLFVDYAFSEKARKLMKERGMVPVPR